MSGKIFIVGLFCSCGAVFRKPEWEWDDSPAVVLAGEKEIAFLKEKGFPLPEEAKCPACRGNPNLMCGFRNCSTFFGEHTNTNWHSENRRM